MGVASSHNLTAAPAPRLSLEACSAAGSGHGPGLSATTAQVTAVTGTHAQIRSHSPSHSVQLNASAHSPQSQRHKHNQLCLPRGSHAAKEQASPPREQNLPFEAPMHRGATRGEAGKGAKARKPLCQGCLNPNPWPQAPSRRTPQLGGFAGFWCS